VTEIDPIPSIFNIQFSIDNLKETGATAFTNHRQCSIGSETTEMPRGNYKVVGRINMSVKKLGLAALFVLAAGWFSDLALAAAAADISVDQIVDGIEKRYAGPGFSADFAQESTVKAMNITDFGSGRIFVKQPGMMRWEYDQPEKQIIITDGTKLWIYKPVDRQVLTGKSPEFFRGGKGASFLADVKTLRQRFDISRIHPENDLFYELKLVPHTKALDIKDIRLIVSRQTFTIMRVVTFNSYGDETRVELINTKFNQTFDDSLFSFTVPKGVDVLQLDE
jgi:outer membrane lipoprotein carrier protein